MLFRLSCPGYLHRASRGYLHPIRTLFRTGLSAAAKAKISAATIRLVSVGFCSLLRGLAFKLIISCSIYKAPDVERTMQLSQSEALNAAISGQRPKT